MPHLHAALEEADEIGKAHWASQLHSELQLDGRDFDAPGVEVDELAIAESLGQEGYLAIS
jgi:hypothetical protein